MTPVFPVYVSIGNTDGKLSHEQWALFYSLTNELLTEVGLVQTVLGAWHSLPATPYVNACWAIVPDPRHVPALRDALARLAARFNQDSIAWAQTFETEFIHPLP